MGGLLSADDGGIKLTRQQLKGDGKWKDIEDLINRWAKRNKKGAAELELWIKSAREEMVDRKHGRLLKEGMANGRIGIMLHPELEAYIKAFYPDFLSTKDELHEFMKRFPKFKVREVI